VGFKENKAGIKVHKQSFVMKFAAGFYGLSKRQSPDAE